MGKQTQIVLIFLTILLGFVKINSFETIQSTDILWMQTYGGKHREVCSSMSPSSDNGVLVIGTSMERDEYGCYYWIHADVDAQWCQISFWGQKNRFDEGTAIISRTEGGYALVGNSAWSYDYLYFDAVLRIFNAEGQYIDGCNYGSEIGGNHIKDYAWALLQCQDGGYAILGQTFILTGGGINVMWLVRTNSDCDLLWKTTYSAPPGQSLVECTDGGFVLLGGGTVLRINSTGEVVWTQYLKGVSGQQIISCTDSGYAVVGNVNGIGFLARLDAEGSQLWNQSYGSSKYLRGIVECQDRGFSLVGHTASNVGTADVLVLRTDSFGNEVWTKSYHFGETDVAEDITQTEDGFFVIAGTTSLRRQDIFLIKVPDSPQYSQPFPVVVWFWVIGIIVVLIIIASFQLVRWGWQKRIQKKPSV